MADANKYSVDIARDDPQNLGEVLQNIATRERHVRIVSVIYKTRLPQAEYVIISENNAPII